MSAAVRSGRVVNWRDRAACLDCDTDLFFPIGTTGPAVERINEAKAVCARCPVSAACLLWAVEVGVEDGIWGGLTEDERRAMKRSQRNQRRRARSHPTPTPVRVALVATPSHQKQMDLRRPWHP